MFQIYRAKLRRADAVMGGLYRYIRHPQYLALIVASIGMVLIWPRYLVLVATVTVIFIYIVLAKVEERICLGQFPGYADYMRQTGMFLPARLTPGFSLPAETRTATRIAVWVFGYVGALGLALLVASMLRAHAFDSLYSVGVRQQPLPVPSSKSATRTLQQQRNSRVPPRGRRKHWPIGNTC